MQSSAETRDTLQLQPIGIIRTPYKEKYHAPRQPGAGKESSEGIITLFPRMNFEQALDDLEGFERIWILSWFHRNTDWKPKVLPPRSGRTKRGVFSTRSPHRPNPIGISVCKLISIKGLELCVENPDLLDGTPILDIKPYIPYADSFPDSRFGWAQEVAGNETPYSINISALAREQTDWLEKNFSVYFLDRVSDTLARDPFPHPFRRIKLHPDGGFVMGAKSWRVFFTVNEFLVTIERIESGYPPEALTRQRSSDAPLHNKKAHVEFQKIWDSA